MKTDLEYELEELENNENPPDSHIKRKFEVILTTQAQESPQIYLKNIAVTKDSKQRRRTPSSTLTTMTSTTISSTRAPSITSSTDIMRTQSSTLTTMTTISSTKATSVTSSTDIRTIRNEEFQMKTFERKDNRIGEDYDKVRESVTEVTDPDELNFDLDIDDEVWSNEFIYEPDPELFQNDKEPEVKTEKGNNLEFT